MKEQLQTPEQPEGLSRKTYQASQNFIHRKIADSDVLISVGSNIANFNGYIELNGSAADLWEKLQTPSRPDELEQLLETLRRYPPHKIGVTIYGASSETYKKVCGNHSAFQKALDGMHMLQTLPSIMEFRTTIIKDNYSDVDNIEKLIHYEFGENCKLIQTRIVTKAVRGACADVESCRLEPEDNVHLAFRRGINIIKKYVGDAYNEQYLSAEYRDCSVDSTSAPSATLFGCNAGMNSYTISWDGKLLACQMMGNFAVNTLTKGFRNAWEHFPYLVKLPSVNETCLTCNNSKICNCCYASRYAETGDLGGCPDYVCRDTAIISQLLNKRRS